MTLLSRETIFLKGLKGKKWLATPLVVSRLIAAIFNTEHIEYHCNYNFPSLRAIFSFVLLSPYVRESTKVLYSQHLDSGFQPFEHWISIYWTFWIPDCIPKWIPDSKPLCIPDSSLWIPDSGFEQQKLLDPGFLILLLGATFVVSTVEFCLPVSGWSSLRFASAYQTSWS